MKRHELHDGRQDDLQPLTSLSLGDIHSFGDLLRAMSHTAFSGRQLGEAFEVLHAMTSASTIPVVMTLSGAMTVAKQGRIICDLIDRGLVDAVVATGALIAHGLTESIGLTHYRYDPRQSDEDLYEKGYNRIYDTLEMESNLNDVERLVSHVLRSSIPEDGVWSSARLCRALGEALSQRDDGPGILRSAFEQNVPVFIPAFSDSEIGLDFSIWSMASTHGTDPESLKELSLPQLLSAANPFNPFLDLQQYAQLMAKSPELGILTIGGGVPRNWAQQVAPYIEIINHRLGLELPVPRFRYGVRICPEPVHWGGLSGCTYSEGVSWGKFVPTSEGGRYAEVHADATTVFPLLIKALFEKCDQDASSP